MGRTRETVEYHCRHQIKRPPPVPHFWIVKGNSYRFSRNRQRIKDSFADRGFQFYRSTEEGHLIVYHYTNRQITLWFLTNGDLIKEAQANVYEYAHNSRGTS
jgi:hypothetical protein